MDRKELVKNKGYWVTKIQLKLFSLIEEYMKENKLNRSQLAKKLGVSKGYITQVLNGDFDHKLSKLVGLSLAINKLPILEFKDIDVYLSGSLSSESYAKEIKLKPDYADKEKPDYNSNYEGMIVSLETNYGTPEFPNIQQNAK